MPPVEADLLVVHATPLVTNGPGKGTKTGEALRDLGEIPDGALAVKDGRVAWVGTTAESAAAVALKSDGARIDATGCVVAPGFVDPHTHLLHAGSRENEFAMRLAGKTYQEIAAAGGGIRSSVRATRTASREELRAAMKRRLDRALLDGTTTIEVKVSYGLNLEQDLKGLEVVGALAEEHPVRIVPTYMGAHEFPDEFRVRRDDYVKELIRGLPEVARQGIARFCDVFCEEGVFTPDQSRAILEAAAAAGLALKVHADEFGASGGSDVAIELGATSADHLHGVPERNLPRLGEAGVIPVLLPGTAFFLRLSQHAPARRMIDEGLPVALATDCNPGSCPTESMPFIQTIACIQFGLQPEEAFSAATVNAAAALRLESEVGRLTPGYSADFQVLEVPGARYLAYHFGRGHVRDVYVRGRCAVAEGRVTS
jgi:imidazolonepropionase